MRLKIVTNIRGAADRFEGAAGGVKMTYRCDRCGKSFEIDSDVTLTELRDDKLCYLQNDYWHTPCSSVRVVNGQLQLGFRSQGRLVRTQNAAFDDGANRLPSGTRLI
jgi:hypothetical protein